MPNGRSPIKVLQISSLSEEPQRDVGSGVRQYIDRKSRRSFCNASYRFEVIGIIVVGIRERLHYLQGSVTTFSPCIYVHIKRVNHTVDHGIQPVSV